LVDYLSQSIYWKKGSRASTFCGIYSSL